MRTLALLNLVTLGVSFAGQGTPPKTPPQVILIANDRIMDPSKELLKPLSPIPIDATDQILAAAMKGDLVVKSKNSIAIYTKPVLEQFPDYGNLMIAKAFNSKGERVIGRTDQDEWARVFYRRILGITESPASGIAQRMLDTNGFSDSPGEVVIDPAYVVEAVVGGKTLKTYCNETRPSIDFKYWLGKGFNWASAPQVRVTEEHFYSTYSLSAAKLERKVFDERITQAFKSNLVFQECARQAKQQLKVPFGVPVDFSSLPDRFRNMFLARTPGLLRLNGLDPKKFSEGDIKKVKITGIGLAVTVTLGLYDKESFSTIVFPLPIV